jgi:hypothetical protein
MNMTTIIAGLSWVISNWQIIATAFSSISSVALFFMHGNAASDLAELKDFVNSLQVSQAPTSDVKKN